MCLIGWFQLYKCTGLCLYSFFILLFPLIDEFEVVSESEKNNWSWMGQFLSFDSFILYSSSKVLASDSEIAFLFFENLFCVICLCLFIIFLFIVCRFVLMYPTVCVWGVITRSYFWLSNSQLCKTVVCLFPRFLNDMRLRMRDARSC